MNPTTWTKGRTLSWVHGKSLASITDGTNTATYTYNGDRLRTKKVTGSKTTEYYILDGTYVGEKTTINGTTYRISYIYDENGAPTGLNIDGSACYFVKNLQGDVIGIMTSDGYVFANYHYDAWGNVTVTGVNGEVVTNPESHALLNPFRYRGYMYDDETGFYYLRARYYDPEVGRFLNADDVMGVNQDMATYNLFVYCGNNPIIRIDESGMFWQIIASMVICAAINVGGSFLAAKITGQEYTWKDAGIAAGIGAICGIPACGPWIGGVVSGIYTGHINYENGASLGGAIISGVIDGMVIMASIGNLAFLSKMESSLLTDIACEAVFGSAGNIISAAASQSAIILGDSDKFSNNNISSHKNQTLDFLNDIKNRARTKVLNGRTVTFGKYMSYVDEDDYNKIYFNVTFS